jgi:hypothetical protein
MGFYFADEIGGYKHLAGAVLAVCFFGAVFAEYETVLVPKSVTYR